MSDNIKKLFLDAENQEIKYGDSSELPQLALDTATSEIKYTTEGTLPEGVQPMEIDLETGEFAYGEIPEPVSTNRILYTVVKGGTQPTSTWITENCSDNVFDAETGEGYLELNEGVTELATEGEKPTPNIFSDKGVNTNIATVEIPSQITSIGDNAFSGCSGLTSVTIPDSVTSIGDSAFDGCTSLAFVTIPDSVTSIGEGAFNGCTSLASVTCFANTPPTLGTDTFNGINTTTCGVPEASISTYKADTSWNKVFNNFVAADAE